MLLVLAFRPGSAPERLIAALAAPLADQARARPAERGARQRRCSGDDRRRSRAPRSTATAAATLSTSSSSPASSKPLRLDRELDRRRSAAGSRPASPPRSPRSSAALSADAGARCSRRRRSPASRSTPALAGEVAELDQAAGARRRSTSCSTATSSARPRFRGASSSATRSCAARVYESIGGGSRLAAHARAATGLAARGARGRRARPPRRAGGRPGRRGGGRGPARGRRRRRRHGRRRSRRAGSTAPCGCCPTAIASARSRSGSRSPRRCARSASSSAAARSCWRRSTLLGRRATSRGGCELTAWCAAVEHWLGRHEDAHLRLTPRLGRARRSRRAPEGAALQIELAVDGLYTLDFEQTLEMGRGALETRARARRPGR